MHAELELYLEFDSQHCGKQTNKTPGYVSTSKLRRIGNSRSSLTAERAVSKKKQQEAEEEERGEKREQRWRKKDEEEEEEKKQEEVEEEEEEQEEDEDSVHVVAPAQLANRCF